MQQLSFQLSFSLSLFLLLLSSCTSSLNSEQQAVADTLQQMFTAMHNKDVATSKDLFVDEGQFYSYVEEKKLLRKSTFQAYLESLGTTEETYTERFWNPTVLVDGNLASLWTRYDFRRDEKFSHCGVEVFNFIKVEGKWKIAAATYTVQTEACPEAGI